MSSYDNKVERERPPVPVITIGSGLKAFQQTYYDYPQNSNVKDMDTVIIDGKSGIEYMLT
jgi:hypothetical protein